MKISTYAIFVMLLMVSFQAQATNYYLSTSGSDSNSGTSSSSAFASLAYAVTKLSAGDVLYVSSGTYNESDSPIVIQTNGSSSSPITISGSSSSRPVFYFDGNESSSNRGVVMDGNYWIWKNIVIENAGDNGMLLSGDNNTIQNCVFKGNHDTGLQLSRYNTSASSISQWPSNNYIVDCEAYDNCDSDNEDADGFAAKLTCGTGNVFERCVSHHNIDDGWDLYTKSDTGPIGVVTFYDCVAHSNGTLSDGSASGSGDKNGYKLGSSSNTVNHILVGCVAFNNGKHGFTDNGNIGSIKFINLTSYNNGDYNYHTRDNASHTFLNCISYQGQDRIVGTASESHNALIDSDFDFDYTVSSSDFESLSPGSNADPCSGSFLHLASSSALIDAGSTSSYLESYVGSAPDLGAIEYGNDDPVEGSVSLSASANDGSVSLNWSTNNIDVRSMAVYRDTDSDPTGRVRIASVGTATSYTDSDVSNGTTYYYWIKVTDASLNTYNSDAVAATPVGAGEAYVALSASSGDGYVNLNWSTTNISVRGMEVYRDTDSDPSGRVRIASVGTATSYTDSDVSNGTTYYYWIKVTDTNLVSYNSEAVGATPTSSGNSNSGEDVIEDDDARTIAYDGSLKAYSNANNGYAINLSNSAGKQIEWQYTAASAGTYTVTLAYTRKASVSSLANVYVNGTLSKTLTLDETNSGEFTSSSFTLTLTSGTNTVIVETAEDGEAADIDYISFYSGTKSASALSSSLIENEYQLALKQNYPNPVYDNTQIPFTLDKESAIKLVVTNMSGKQVALISTTTLSEGDHSIEFSPEKYGLQSGYYVYTLITNSGKISKVMIVK